MRLLLSVFGALMFLHSFTGYVSALEVAPSECAMDYKEKVVCANVLCDFGLIRGEWSDECTDWKVELAIESAKLPPWKSMPQCIKRKSNCAGDGPATKEETSKADCEAMTDPEMKQGCLLGLSMGTQEGGADYIERNGQDGGMASDEVYAQLPPPVEPVDVTYSIGMDYLITNVDERFSDRVELMTAEIKDPLEFITYGIADDIFHKYFVAVETGDVSKQSYYSSILIADGHMRDECSSVSAAEFYNCNYNPDIPKACWALHYEEQLITCMNEVALK